MAAPSSAWRQTAYEIELTRDTGVVAAQYDSARRWVDLMARLAGPDRIWDEGLQLWERWDSLLPDGTVNPGQMTSFNHYALG